MKTHLLLLATALLASPTFASGNYATPGLCGPDFEPWDLNCDGKIDGDEAAESQREYHEYNNARHIPAAREGISDAEVAAWNEWAEKNKNPNQVGEWQLIYSGSTTGSVNIASNISDVYVVTSGSGDVGRMFPRNSKSMLVSSNICSSQHLSSTSTTTVYVKWDGNKLTGGSDRYDTAYGPKTCAITIKEVYVR